MDVSTLKRIESDPNYQKLVSERKSFGWTLAIITLVLYYGFIADRRLCARDHRDQGRRRHHHRHHHRRRAHSRLDPADRHLRDARQQRLRRSDHCDRQRGQDRGEEKVKVSHPTLRARRRARPRRRRRPTRPARSKPARFSRPTGPPIIIFVAFVLVTLGITYWAARHTRTTKDFYAAGGGITGFQNGLAIAGDYMSAASFLGITALVYTSGYYGLIYSIGFLVGWPIIMFLMAEPLAQPRPLHLRRRRLLPAAGDADPRHGGDRHAGRRSPST